MILNKKLATGLGICTLAFGLVACGGEETTSEEQEPTQEETTPTAEAEGLEHPEQETASILDTEEIPEVVATVNGQDIEKELFVSTLEQQAMQASMQGIDFESEEGALYLEDLRNQVLDQFISTELITTAAHNEGIEATDEEIDHGLTDLMAQSGLESEEQLQELLDSQGISMDEVRDDIATNVINTKYLEQNLANTDVSEEEIQAFYDEAVAGFSEDQSEVPSLEEVRSEIEYQLQMDNHIETLKENSDVQIYI